MTKNEFRRGLTIFFIPGIIIGGVMVPLIISLFNPSFTKPSSRIPKVRAKEFKDNFGWPAVQLNPPETEYLVHDYERLKKYIDSLKFDQIDVPDSLRKYPKGIAFYFGRSDKRKTYIRIDSTTKDTSVLEKNNLTVLLYPVYYSDTTVQLTDKYFTDSGFTIKLPFYYKKLRKVYTDIDSLNRKIHTNRREEGDGNEPFDLGHTKP